MVFVVLAAGFDDGEILQGGGGPGGVVCGREAGGGAAANPDVVQAQELIGAGGRSAKLRAGRAGRALLAIRYWDHRVLRRHLLVFRRDFFACQAATITHEQLVRMMRRSAHPSSPSTPAGSRFGAC